MVSHRLGAGYPEYVGICINGEDIVINTIPLIFYVSVVGTGGSGIREDVSSENTIITGTVFYGRIENEAILDTGINVIG